MDTDRDQRRPARRRDSGQGAIEYVGIAVVVVALITGVAGVVAKDTQVGKEVAYRICRAISGIGGGGGACGTDPAQAQAASDQPSKACVQSSDEESVKLGVTVMFVDAGEKGTIKVEKLSDGTYRVTATGEFSAYAMATLAKGEGTLKLGDDLDVGAGFKASAGAGLGLNAGAEYIVKSSDDAAKLVGWYKKQAGIQVATQVSPVAGFSLAAASAAWDWLTGHSYSPPSPSAVYLEAGEVAKLSGSAYADVVGGDASIDYSDLVGGKLNTSTGALTVYSKVKLSAKGSVALGFSADGGADGTVVVGTTYDKSGKITDVSMSAAGSASGTAGVGIRIPGVDPKNSLKILSDTGASGGTGVTLNADVPVTDANRGQVTAALVGLNVIRAVGQASSGGLGGLSGDAAAVPAILAAAAQDGTITAQRYDVNATTPFQAALGGVVADVGAGVSASAATKTQQQTDAWYLDKNGTWQQWTRCTG